MGSQSAENVDDGDSYFKNAIDVVGKSFYLIKMVVPAFAKFIVDPAFLWT